MNEWVSVKHKMPPLDKAVKYKYPCGSFDVGVIDKEFIEKNGITHWNEDTTILWKDEKSRGD